MNYMKVTKPRMKIHVEAPINTSTFVSNLFSLTVSSSDHVSDVLKYEQK
jgi:hypothetical protein